MTDDFQRAYAVLGLRAGASLAETRRRFRYLAHRWHPDRHTGDPQSQAEAADTMRRINGAYQLLTDHLSGLPPKEAITGPTAPPSGRLARHQVERVVHAIESDSPLDKLLSGLGWVGSTVEGLLVILFAIGCVTRLVALLSRWDFAAIRDDPAFIILLVVVLLFLAHEISVRRRATRASRKDTNGN